MPWPAVNLHSGSQAFTLVGNDNSGIEREGTPRLTLTFDGGASVSVSTLQPSGSAVFDGHTVTVGNFNYIPWQRTGINRVNDTCSSPDGYMDTVATFTSTVS